MTCVTPDLSDLAREQLGAEPFFTAHHNTAAGVCQSRIDQLYTPNLDGLAPGRTSQATHVVRAAGGY